MTISLTDLRSNLYKEIDKLIETGIPIEIEHKGHKIKILLEKSKSKLDRLIKRQNIYNCTDEELIHNNWLENWQNNNLTRSKRSNDIKFPD